MAWSHVQNVARPVVDPKNDTAAAAVIAVASDDDGGSESDGSPPYLRRSCSNWYTIDFLGRKLPLRYGRR